MSAGYYRREELWIRFARPHGGTPLFRGGR
jgi:hypothetical protein